MTTINRRIAQLELGHDTDVRSLPTFGELVQAHLEAQGLTVERTAALWDIPVQRLWATLEGRAAPAQVERWADILDWPAEALRRRLAAEQRARAEAA